MTIADVRATTRSVSDRPDEFRFRSVRWFVLAFVVPILFGSLALVAGVAFWRQGDRLPGMLTAVLSLVVMYAPVAHRRSGYIEDRGSLGCRNGLTGHVDWIELGDVVAISAGVQWHLAKTRFVVLWTTTPITSRSGTVLHWFTSWMVQPSRPGDMGGRVRPFRVDLSLLGRTNACRLIERLAARGVDVDAAVPESWRSTANTSGRR